jgi:hypothetical protein
VAILTRHRSSAPAARLSAANRGISHNNLAPTANNLSKHQDKEFESWEK